MSEATKETTTVTITVDLKDVAGPVKDYYDTMQEGQLKEMFGDKDGAFESAKQVIFHMATALEAVLGVDNVMKVNEIVSNLASAEEEDAE
jgi:hypothetical protein